MNILKLFKRNGSNVVANNSAKDTMASFLETQEPLKSQKLWAALQTHHPELYKSIQTIVDLVPDLQPSTMSRTQYSLLQAKNGKEELNLHYHNDKKTWTIFTSAWKTIGSDQEAAQSLLNIARERGYIKVADDTPGLSGEPRFKIARGDFNFQPLQEPTPSPRDESAVPGKLKEVVRLTS